MMKRLGGLLGVIFLALILAGCVVTEEKHVEHSAFDGAWMGYYVPVRGSESRAICLKDGVLRFDVERGIVVNGISVNAQYAAERGPGVVSFWGEVSQNGIVSGGLKGGYVVGNWVAKLELNEVGVGAFEPSMGLTSETYECVYKMVFSKEHSEEELSRSWMLKGEGEKVFNKDSFDISSVADIKRKLSLQSLKVVGGGVEENYSLGIVNGFSLTPIERSYAQRVYKERVATSSRVSDKVPAVVAQKYFDFTTKKMDKNAIAVVVGNKNYSINDSDVPDVLYAHNDHDAMINYLVNGLGFLRENIISEKDATQSKMNRIFGVKSDFKGELYNWVKKDKSDLFVFYSGHGVPDIDTKKTYLMPVDASPNSIRMNGYSMDLLYENLSQIGARNVMVVIDACFSGLSHSEELIKNVSALKIKSRDPRYLLDSDNVIVITASANEQVASWDGEYELGLLTRYFLEGMTGIADERGNKDGKITLNELKVYLDSEVVYHARRLYGRNQYPQITGDLSRVLR